MKISKLFPFACVALMMTACASDKDEMGGGTKPGSDPQYLAVNIVNVGATPTTRGTDDYENGTTEESTIKRCVSTSSTVMVRHILLIILVLRV